MSEVLIGQMRRAIDEYQAKIDMFKNIIVLLQVKPTSVPTVAQASPQQPERSAPPIQKGSLAEKLDRLPWEQRGNKGYESIMWNEAEEPGELDDFLKKVKEGEKFTVSEENWTYLYNPGDFGVYLGRVPKRGKKT